LCRKVSKRAQLRAPTVLLVITPYADAYRHCFTLKIIISLTYILTEIGAQTAYGNISDAILSLVILHVCFPILVCTAHSQTNLSLIYTSHIARSNIAKHKFIVFISHSSFFISNFAFCILHSAFFIAVSLRCPVYATQTELHSGNLNRLFCFCIGTGTKVLAKLLSRSVSLYALIYGVQTLPHSGN